ncbi:MAG: InlB B-repeat-containing protein [Lachnospiraceae bacterium]|nr:InlB B-repeat-containing protein [Lachnospiraceae bacterium]
MVKRIITVLAAIVLTAVLMAGLAVAGGDYNEYYIQDIIDDAQPETKLVFVVECVGTDLEVQSGVYIGGIYGRLNGQFETAYSMSTISKMRYGDTLSFTIDTARLKDGYDELRIQPISGFEVCSLKIVSSAKRYSISYELNGGTNNPLNPVDYNKYDGPIYLKNPSKEGYIFSGWYTDAALTKKTSGIAYGQTGNRKFYAKYTDGTGTTRKLSFDAAGGNGTLPAAITAAGGAAVTVPRANLSRPGYYFLGWSLQAGETTAVYKSGDKVVLSTNTTLYAVWQQIEYRYLYFDFNRGTGNEVEPIKRQLNASVTIPKITVSRPGYYFMGWSKRPYGTADYKTGSTIKLDRSYTLFAVWKPSKPEYHLTYDFNGGYGECPNGNNIPLLKDTVYTVPKFSYIGRYDYYFLGWATVPYAATAEYKTGSQITITKDLKFYAVWKSALPTKKVFFNLNGGTGSVPSYLEAQQNHWFIVPEFSLSRTDYTFAGWSTDKDAAIAQLYTGSGISMQQENITLYAIWTCNYTQYAISFDANGGTGTVPASKLVIEGRTMTIPKANLTRTGFYFLGWSTDKNAKTAQYTSGKTMTVNANTVLYAVWKPSGYLLTFNVNGGKGEVAALSAKAGVSLTIPKTSVSRRGYYFLGWATTATATKATYTSGKTITLTKNTTLYAVWKKKSSKVDLGGIHVLIGDWWSGDADLYWDTVDDATREYQQSLMTQGNYTITRGSVYPGGWANQAEAGILSIMMDEPLADVMVFDYRFIGNFFAQEEPLFCDVSKCEAFDFSDEKWNKAVIDAMTIGDKIYGFAVGFEPQTGIYYNKNLYATLRGSNKINELYDLQASGNWTWAKFEEIIADLTRDTDNDGKKDVYGLSAQQSYLFEMATVTNGHQFVEKDSNGRYVSKFTSADIIADCEWAYSLYTKGYIRRQLEEDWQWDYFRDDFMQQKSVLLVDDAYMGSQFLGTDYDTGERRCNFDFGFVCFPRGPKANSYIAACRENTYVIPNCTSTRERLEDIAYAFNAFTEPTPNTPSDAWKTSYLTYFSENETRAFETIDLLMHSAKRTTQCSYPIPGMWDNNYGVIQSKLLYNIDSVETTPTALLQSLEPELNAGLADFNSKIK